MSSCEFWKTSKNTHFAGAFVFPDPQSPALVPAPSLYFPALALAVVPNVYFPVMTTFTDFLEVIY